jgi:site-specific recombinase XerD
MNIAETSPYKEFLACYKSPATVEDYLGDFKMFHSYLVKINKALLDADQDDLEGYIAFLRARGITDVSVRRRMAPVAKMYKRLFNRHKIQENPAVCWSDLKFDPKPRLKKSLSKDDRARLITSLDWDNEPKQSMAILLGYHCGMRLHEIQKVAFKDFDFEKGLVSILGKGNKVRQVYLSSLLISKLALFVDKSPMFDCSKATISYWIKQRFKTLGIKGSAHSLRHTYCTELAENGIQLPIIKELAGHSSIITTEGYVLTTEEAKKEAVHKVFG